MYNLESGIIQNVLFESGKEGLGLSFSNDNLSKEEKSSYAEQFFLDYKYTKEEIGFGKLIGYFHNDDFFAIGEIGRDFFKEITGGGV